MPPQPTSCADPTHEAAAAQRAVVAAPALAAAAHMTHASELQQLSCGQPAVLLIIVVHSCIPATFCCQGFQTLPWPCCISCCARHPRHLQPYHHHTLSPRDAIADPIILFVFFTSNTCPNPTLHPSQTTVPLDKPISADGAAQGAYSFGWDQGV